MILDHALIVHYEKQKQQAQKKWANLLYYK